MISYPESGYNSLVTTDYANEYFADRINAESWDAMPEATKEKLLIRGYRVVTSYVNESDAPLLDMQTAQMEQALYEYRFSPDAFNDPLAVVSIDGVRAEFAKSVVARMAPEVVLLLKPYRKWNAISIER